MKEWFSGAGADEPGEHPRQLEMGLILAFGVVLYVVFFVLA